MKRGIGLLAAAVLWGALCFPPAAVGQTAEKLDAVLAAEQVSFAQAALVVLPAAGILSQEAGADAAFAAAGDWLPRRAEMNAPIRMGELSYLVMRSFGFSGGILYALFPGPRYAYRAMAWRRLLPLKADPYRTLSGEDLLYIIGQVLAFTGDGELAPAPVPAGEAPSSGTSVRMEVEQGEGLSSGPEGLLPYKGEFEIE
ncbi:MAG: hypothetical protein LBP23_08820 [Treponema sp.]|jgi:hypothetical protein|nr:hypothetical protein [Treponema sp.]